MKKNQKGFTLVEMIVVIVILAILAAILVPTLIQPMMKRTREAEIQSDAVTALRYVQKAVADKSLTHFGTTEVTLGTTQADGASDAAYSDVYARIAGDISADEWECSFVFDQEFALTSFVFQRLDGTELVMKATAVQTNGYISNPVEWTITY